ncbi:conserved hypothetical protein [Hyella patelloides LEGE 07179]|uniref:Heme oxygenase n=2 Tax=Hyella TaxID=945733 RepID=A0A563VSM0_9CYAN|nr:conserved hypothetical protein [Hyella patelloides LEGE 07179]VEP14438.1 conserved hypothetical protein [Hyella patelloides LEGE 07179]
MLQETTVNGNMLMNLNHYQYEDRSKSNKLTIDIKAKIHKLSEHPVYSELTSIAKIECFISYHIFVYWDFMKLLKSLQNKLILALQGQFIECNDNNKKLINEIILSRESELYSYGELNEDFAIYLHSMAEIGVDPYFLWSFLKSEDNLHLLKPGIKELVAFNLKIVQLATIEETAATFFFGQEQLTFSVLLAIIKVLKQENKECSSLISYADKTIQKNSSNSEIIAFKILDYLCQNEISKVRALKAGLKAINYKKKLWDYALAEMTEIS